jgi:AcrR family transcriptional regulator
MCLMEKPTVEQSVPAEQVRQRLLDAGEALFAAHGFEAANVREITRRAGCNIAAINYHFGGKEALYREVYVRRMGEVRDYRVRRLREALEAPGLDLRGLLRAFASAFVDPIRGADSGRLIPHLMAREMTDPHLPPGMLFNQMIAPVAGLLVEGLGRFCPNLSPRQIRLCMISLVSQLIETIHIGRMAQREGELPAEYVRDLQYPGVVDHVVEFSVAAIERINETAGAGQLARQGKPAAQALGRTR